MSINASARPWRAKQNTFSRAAETHFNTLQRTAKDVSLIRIKKLLLAKDADDLVHRSPEVSKEGDTMLRVSEPTTNDVVLSHQVRVGECF